MNHQKVKHVSHPFFLVACCSSLRKSSVLSCNSNMITCYNNLTFTYAVSSEKDGWNSEEKAKINFPGAKKRYPIQTALLDQFYTIVAVVWYTGMKLYRLWTEFQLFPPHFYFFQSYNYSANPLSAKPTK